MTPTELADYLRDRLGDQVTGTKVAYDQLTVDLEAQALPDTAQLCKEDPNLAFEFFDFMSGVDMKEDGFAVVTHLYSHAHGHHVTLRVLAPGGREDPRVPSITSVYRGANWHERETYDMFGVVFEGHPGLLPRILTVENFEGWPLRKEFLLTTREAKPWPGLKEPKEAGEDDGEAAEEAADAAEVEDKAAAAKERAERARRKAAELRKKKAGERAAEATEAGEDERVAAQDAAASGEEVATEPESAAELADTAVAHDAAAGTVTGDVAAGATQDEPGTEKAVPDPQAEQAATEGAEPQPGASPGVTEGGRTDDREPAPPSGDLRPHERSGRRDERQGGGADDEDDDAESGDES